MLKEQELIDAINNFNYQLCNQLSNVNKHLKSIDDNIGRIERKNN